MTTVVTGAGAKPLTFGQLEALWIDAGGPPAWAPTMAGVAYAESGGVPGTLQTGGSPTPDGPQGEYPFSQTGWGLWQITPAASAEQGQELLNPLTNAQAAVAKFNSQGIGAWTADPVGQVAINQGSPLTLGQVVSIMQQKGLAGTSPSLLKDAQANPTAAWAGNYIANSVIGESGVNSWNPVPQLATNVGDVASDLNPLNSVDSLISWLSSHATRILEFVGGVMLIGLGLVIFFESTSTGQKITSDAAVAAAA